MPSLRDVTPFIEPVPLFAQVIVFLRIEVNGIALVDLQRKARIPQGARGISARLVGESIATLDAAAEVSSGDFGAKRGFGIEILTAEK